MLPHTLDSDGCSASTAAGTAASTAGQDASELVLLLRQDGLGYAAHILWIYSVVAATP